MFVVNTREIQLAIKDFEDKMKAYGKTKKRLHRKPDKLRRRSQKKWESWRRGYKERVFEQMREKIKFNEC